jgi:hypothetical protein
MSSAPLPYLSPLCAGRGRRIFAAGEGHGTALIARSVFADRKSPSPRKGGAREHTALGAAVYSIH